MCNVDCLRLGGGSREVEIKRCGGVLSFSFLFPALRLYSHAQNSFGYFRVSHWSENPFAPLHCGYLKHLSVSLSKLSIFVSQ
jgi:hypothetical protein